MTFLNQEQLSELNSGKEDYLPKFIKSIDIQVAEGWLLETDPNLMVEWSKNKRINYLIKIKEFKWLLTHNLS